MAYDIVGDTDAKTHEEKHSELKNFGFKIDKYAKNAKALKKLLSFWSYIKIYGINCLAKIDGIVVSVNSIFLVWVLLEKAPRGAITF